MGRSRAPPCGLQRPTGWGCCVWSPTRHVRCGLTVTSHALGACSGHKHSAVARPRTQLCADSCRLLLCAEGGGPAVIGCVLLLTAADKGDLGTFITQLNHTDGWFHDLCECRGQSGTFQLYCVPEIAGTVFAFASTRFFFSLVFH